MKKREWNEGLDNLDPEIVERYVEEKDRLRHRKKRMRTMLRFVAVAACIALVLGILIVLPMLREDAPAVIPKPDRTDNGRYKDFSVSSPEIAIEWPWEYLAVYEKYSYINIDGAEYEGWGRELLSSHIGEKLGVYTATGYGFDGEYYEEFEAYRIKDVSHEKTVAVRMNDRYYVFHLKKYDPPKALGEMLTAYCFSKHAELSGFSLENMGVDEEYYALENDDYIWSILDGCASAQNVMTSDWKENKVALVSFTLSSEVLGINRRVMYVTESGYLWTNAFGWEYVYFIGEDAAGKIIKYAMENSKKAEYEPQYKSLVGTVTEITDEYFLVDDSVLCKDPADGITFKILLDDIRISRYFSIGVIGVGDTVVVKYEGDVDNRNGNTINGVVSISEAFISGGNVYVPE